jgi:DNA-directed RNA polymerase subunit RPC12/RpoP
MSRLVSRILLSIFMFPLGGIFYLFIFVSGESLIRSTAGGYSGRSSESALFIFSDLATWVFIGIYWCLLWRAGVQWTLGRTKWTVLSVIGAAIVGVAVGAIATALTPDVGEYSFGAFVGGVLAIVLWLIATVFVWRETALERAQRVRASTGSTVACPTCGYNLTGLTEARCPECGSKFTLDELLAAQQPKMEVEIE